MKNKQYYIDCYIKVIEEDRQYYIKEVGNDNEWDSSMAEADLNTEEIVGYFLKWYEKEALNHALINDVDEEVIKILENL